MADILDDEILELEGLFASDNSSMRNRHIEFARRDYVKLKQLGYVRAPSELKLNEYLWVDVLSYLQPRTQVEKIEENLEIRILQHPNGLWTYGFFVSYGTRGWSFLPGLFTGLFRVPRMRRIIRLSIAWSDFYRKTRKQLNLWRS